MYRLKETLQTHNGNNLLYTDAFKSSRGVGIAIVYKNKSIRCGIPGICSIYTAEAEATFKTFDLITYQGNMHHNYINLLTR